MTTDAMDDTYQAIRLVRSHAAEWGLDPKKIGIMGFSAGISRHFCIFNRKM